MLVSIRLPFIIEGIMEEVKSNENNENKVNKETKVFAKGFCFAKIFILFLLGCIFGTYYEEILWRFTNGARFNIWTF